MKFRVIDLKTGEEACIYSLCKTNILHHYPGNFVDWVIMSENGFGYYAKSASHDGEAEFYTIENWQERFKIEFIEEQQNAND